VRAKDGTLEKQVKDWLERSGLTAKDLPGEIIPDRCARSIHFYDIDGKRLPGADIQRNFIRNGVEPKLKYKNPLGELPHIYYPRVGNVEWRAEVSQSDRPKIFAEGCAKATIVTKLGGFPTCGIQGCWGWRAAKHGFLRLPEFNDYVWPTGTPGARCYWIPDRDRNPKAIADVQRSANAFGRVMETLGAEFYFVWLPLLEGYKKVGIDDFLFYYSDKGTDWKLAMAHFAKLLQRTPRWEDFEITEPGNARRWVSLYGSTFRYAGRDWLAYRNGVWQKDHLLEQVQTTKEMFEGMIEDAELAADNVRRKVLGAHVTAQRIENVGRIAKSDPAIIINRNLLDRHPLFVNCLNGTLELPKLKSGGKLVFREASPDDLLTRQAAAHWVPDAKCPTFLKALDVWTGRDKALKRTIQQLLGISCTGVTDEQVFIVLYGPGQSGKSTLIEINREILASYAVGLAAETLLLRRNGAPEERKVAALPGARFASACETEQTGVMDENLVKLLTGQDTVTGRRLYEEQFDFMPEAKIWLRTNNRPEIRGTDNAIWRRVIALPFNHIIPENEKDSGLREKLRAEREGIFRWMIEGYMDYAANGIFKAPSVQQAIKEYRHEQDIYGRFFEEECAFDPQYSIRRDALYNNFKNWFEEVKGGTARAPSAKNFKAELLKRYTAVYEGKVKVTAKGEKSKQEHRWKGICPKADMQVFVKAHSRKAAGA
jgi:P4 family phage/plasmid primase-like protien